MTEKAAAAAAALQSFAFVGQLARHSGRSPPPLYTPEPVSTFFVRRLYPEALKVRIKQCRTVSGSPGQGGARMRAPHLHFDIQGRFDRKVTQMFFPGEPLNDQDRLFLDVPRNRESLIPATEPARQGSELILRWDIILALG